MGKEATFSATRATFGGTMCENPRYEKTVLSQEEFSNANRIDLKQLGIDAGFVTEIDIHDSGKNLFGIFYVKGVDALVYFDDGVYFELTRPVARESKP